MVEIGAELRRSGFHHKMTLGKQEDIFECAPFLFNMESQQMQETRYGSTQSRQLNETAVGVPVPLKKNSLDATCSVDMAGVSLTWRDLSVFVPRPKMSPFAAVLRRQSSEVGRNSTPGSTKLGRHRRVLNNVSGAARPGTLLAIMGASGSGKTTLLNTLAMRLAPKTVLDGELAVNGHLVDRAQMQHMAGFVHQTDYFYGALTVLEHLTFTAKLRLDSRFTHEQITQRVQEIIMQTGLRKCENTHIGTPGVSKGLSGGERKRLAFASEVIGDPPLLFCDEPTSGLDLFLAQTVIGVLENLAARGKTILCSIHQPSSEVFSMFNELLLLSEGRVAFMGPAKDAQDFFSSVGYVCPPMHNPADFFIHTLAMIPGQEQSSSTNVKNICEQYAASAYAAQTEYHIQTGLTKHKELGLENFLVYDTEKHKSSWSTQFFWLLWRGMVHSLRTPSATATRLIQKLTIGIFLALIYTNIDWQHMGGSDVMGIVFLYITENTYPSMYSVIQLFPGELPIFLREQQNGLYGTKTFYLTKILTMIPAFIIEPTLFVFVTYWIIGLNPHFRSVLITVVAVILLTNVSSACGCMFSAMFKTVPMAMTSVVPFDYIMMITGGLFLNINTIPWYIGWTQYISWFRYSNEALSIAQWHGVKNITCDSSAIVCFHSGEEILENYGFKSSRLFECLGSLLALYFAFHALGCLALVRRTKTT